MSSSSRAARSIDLVLPALALGALAGAATAVALNAPGVALALLFAALVAGAAALVVRRIDRDGAAASRRHAAFVAGLPLGLAQIGRDGSIIAANAAFAAAVGVEAGGLVGRRLGDIAAPGSDPGGAAPSLGTTLRLRRADGRALAARVVGASPGDGGAFGLALVPDGEAAQRLEAAAAAAERRFQAIFDDAPFGMARLDDDGAIVEANPALVRMIGGAEPVDRPLISLVRAQDRVALERALKLAQAGAPAGEPVECHLAGAGERPVEAIVVAASGGGAMAFLRDTSQRAALSVQLAQSQKMQAIGQLAGGVAHDFNNLLTAIIGFCDLLLQRHRAGDQSFADVMQIKQNANRAAGLVRQLLAFSRQQRLEPRVIVITDTLAELTHLLRRLIGQSIELNVMHGRDLWPVRVDQGQLEQVVINLAVNARDAMPAGGTLTIATDNLEIAEPVRRGDAVMPPGAYARLQVIDTGTGIPADIVERIFEPFFSTKEIGSGTGLGLSTVYGIVKQTGGFIFVDSVLGQGSTFSIYLPRHLGPVAADVEASDRRAGSDDVTGAGTILLVEDEDAVRLFGARALRGKGYKVIEARAGDAALDLMGDGQQIDLLISDMMMPGMDGPTLIGHARSRRPDLPVVCISGYAEDAMRAQLAQHKDIAFLAKPFSLKQLALVVKDALARERVG